MIVPTDRDILMRAVRGVDLPAVARLTEAGKLVAARHGLLGVLYFQGPAELREQVTPAFARLKARQEVMNASLPVIQGHLASAGIESSVVKGPAVAAAYADPRLRTFTDLDLVVRRDDLDAAVARLTTLPWRVVVPPKGPVADKRDISMTVGGLSFTVDLHWDLFAYRQMGRRARDATAEAWANAETRPDAGVVLSEAGRVAFLCTHAILDHRFRLILFRDLAELAADAPDWEELARFASRHGLRSLCYVALTLAKWWADADVPKGVLADMRPNTLPAGILERLLPRIDPLTFEGKRAHPVNLVTVLLHDDLRHRVRLLLRAPLAVPDWRRRTAADRRPNNSGSALVVVSSNARRGAETFGSRIVDGLASRGWDAHLVSLTSTGGGERVDAFPLSSHTPATLPSLDLRLASRLRREAAGYDVVLANGSSTLRYTAAALFGLLGRPALVYVSVGESDYWITGRLASWRHSALLSRADLVAAVSRETGRQLGRRSARTGRRVYWAPTGVEIPEEERRSPHEGTNLLMVGSLSPEKRPEVALEVAEQVPATRLRFVGDGPLRDYLQSESVRRGLDGRVEFTGVTSDPARHYRWADILLLTSRTEGLPGVVLEAAAHGTPSVAFAVGGTGEVIIAGRTGVLIPPGHTDLLVRAVSELSAEPARLRQMGSAARSHVAEAYPLEAAIDRYEALLKKAASLRRS